MATRDENIKKINDELEKLSDEELDKVAGGAVQIIRSVDNPSPQKPYQNPYEQKKYGFVLV